jgi:hypothetical protein
MHRLSLKSFETEFPFVLLYVAIFGLSDLYVKKCLHTLTSQIVYYVILLFLAMMIYYDFNNTLITPLKI